MRERENQTAISFDFRANHRQLSRRADASEWQVDGSRQASLATGCHRKKQQQKGPGLVNVFLEVRKKTTALRSVTSSLLALALKFHEP